MFAKINSNYLVEIQLITEESINYTSTQNVYFIYKLEI